MKCEIHGGESNSFYLLPIHQENGSMITIACEACAKKSSAYCKTHEEIHLGFAGGYTLCVKCINEAVDARGEELGELLVAQVDLDGFSWIDLREYAEAVAKRTNESETRIIGRAIIVAAMKVEADPKEIIRQTVANGDPNILLPPPMLC